MVGHADNSLYLLQDMDTGNAVDCMAGRPFYANHFLAWARLGLILVFIFGAGIRPGYSQTQTHPSPTAIIVSKHIKPYMDAASGLETFLQEHGASVRIILLEERDAFEREQVSKRLQEGEFGSAVGIGPQAAEFLWSIEEMKVPRVFSMVLHPHQAVERSPSKLCGVSLSIPVDIQLQTIEEFLPGRPRIGLLFHPQHNQAFYRKAVKAAKSSHIEVIPLRIFNQGDISQNLDQYLEQVDILWLVPDRGLNSKKVVEYIIKQALYAKVPVVGYNRFFHESGAAVSFVFDYGRIGRQTGRLLLRRVEAGDSAVQTAVFEVWENERIYTLLGLERE